MTSSISSEITDRFNTTTSLSRGQAIQLDGHKNYRSQDIIKNRTQLTLTCRPPPHSDSGSHKEIPPVGIARVYVSPYKPALLTPNQKA